MRRLLEIGSYVVPAYAGMILAEQSWHVDKLVWGDDPIETLDRGDELWEWINHGKTLHRVHLSELEPWLREHRYDGVIDNVRASSIDKYLSRGQDWWAESRLMPWVSMRADVGERSFDVVCQARATMEHGPWLPWYLGDTAGGLWCAFKLLAAMSQLDYRHHVLYHASLLAKLVEGELVVPAARRGRTAWDPPGDYFADEHGAHVRFRGEELHEPIRDHAWKLAHLHHRDGRIIV